MRETEKLTTTETIQMFGMEEVVHKTAIKSRIVVWFFFAMAICSDAGTLLHTLELTIEPNACIHVVGLYHLLLLLARIRSQPDRDKPTLGGTKKNE